MNIKDRTDKLPQNRDGHIVIYLLSQKCKVVYEFVVKIEASYSCKIE